MVKIANYQQNASFSSTNGEEKTLTSCRNGHSSGPKGREPTKTFEVSSPRLEGDLQEGSEQLIPSEDLSNSESSSSSLFLLQPSSLAPIGCVKRGRFLVWPVAASNDGGSIRRPPPHPHSTA